MHNLEFPESFPFRLDHRVIIKRFFSITLNLYFLFSLENVLSRAEKDTNLIEATSVKEKLRVKAS